MEKVNVIWFRRGLRLHDNPALHEALKNCQKFLAIYIFDTTFSGNNFNNKTFQIFNPLSQICRDLLEVLPQQWIPLGGSC
jgi:deoxyribodipyrimidine photolyase